MRPTNINWSKEVHCLNNYVSSFFVLTQSHLMGMRSKKSQALILLSLKCCITRRAYIQGEVLAGLRRHI